MSIPASRYIDSINFVLFRQVVTSLMSRLEDENKRLRNKVRSVVECSTLNTLHRFAIIPCALLKLL